MNVNEAAALLGRAQYVAPAADRPQRSNSDSIPSPAPSSPNIGSRYDLPRICDRCGTVIEDPEREYCWKCGIDLSHLEQSRKKIHLSNSENYSSPRNDRATQPTVAGIQAGSSLTFAEKLNRLGRPGSLFVIAGLLFASLWFIYGFGDDEVTRGLGYQVGLLMMVCIFIGFGWTIVELYFLDHPLIALGLLGLTSHNIASWLLSSGGVENPGAFVTWLNWFIFTGLCLLVVGFLARVIFLWTRQAVLGIPYTVN